MADMVHFGRVSYVRGNVRVDLNLEKYGARTKKAQWWLGEQVLQACRAVMPLSTGSLQQRSHSRNNLGHVKERSFVMDGGSRVVFPGPYARFLYGGLVMVDPVTRSPWARKGEKKVVTDRRLTYSNPEAVDHWFDTAKARNGDAWIEGVRNLILKGRL